MSDQRAGKVTPSPATVRTREGLRASAAAHVAGPEAKPALLVVWLTGTAALILFAGLAWYLAPLEPSVVALQFAFTPRSFAAIVHAWPAEHLLRYRSHLPVDFLLLGCYGAFGYLITSRSALFARYSPAVRTAATWTLPLAAAFDAAENTLHLWLTAAPRFGVALPYAISGTCSTFKWALLTGFGIAVVHALARAER